MGYAANGQTHKGRSRHSLLGCVGTGRVDRTITSQMLLINLPSRLPTLQDSVQIDICIFLRYNWRSLPRAPRIFGTPAHRSPLIYTSPFIVTLETDHPRKFPAQPSPIQSENATKNARIFAKNPQVQTKRSNMRF